MLHDKINLKGIITAIPNYVIPYLRRVWRYQRGNQNPYIEEGQDNTMEKRTKGQTMIYKTLHKKLKIEKREPH